MGTKIYRTDSSTAIWTVKILATYFGLVMTVFIGIIIYAAFGNIPPHSNELIQDKPHPLGLVIFLFFIFAFLGLLIIMHIIKSKLKTAVKENKAELIYDGPSIADSDSSSISFSSDSFSGGGGSSGGGGASGSW